jgi:hypothetical protein
MNNGHHPAETYQKMKMIIVETTAEALFQLNEINKTYKTNFTIDDCINKVFTQISREDFKENFIEEQESRGETEFCPNLMSTTAIKNFQKIVAIAESRISHGQSAFKKSEAVDLEKLIYDKVKLDKNLKKNFYDVEIER